MASLDNKEVTEKTLALGLSAAVNQHDAEAAKEESAAAGRGTHARQVWHHGDRREVGGGLLMSCGVVCAPECMCVCLKGAAPSFPAVQNENKRIGLSAPPDMCLFLP